jgi:1,2-diacylglycerol 3-beta-galactosyltransferase
LTYITFVDSQEAGNVPYVVNGGFGYYRSRPKKIADAVYELFEDKDKLAKMGETARSKSLPGAALSIGSDIGKIALRQCNEIPQRI